jgi:hypothetical protein
MKVTENLNRDSVIVEAGNGIGGSNAFTIKTNAKMFEMLSSKIYTDKILAPIRELACNAYDAQVEAGKADIPIVIHMPDYNNPIFAVTDCGLGMSVEQVMTQYTTYGESGKEDSNDYIGCLGLGSKSPLCYTDQFFIETTKDGQTNKFICYYENGVPMIQHTDSENTGADSGTTVSFAVKNSDITVFFNKCSQFFKTFRPFPQFIGATFIEREMSKIGSMIKLDHGNSLQGINILCGNVLYRLSSNALTITQQSKLEQYCYIYSPMILEVPVGSVDISVSRESLELTDKTLDTIADVAKEVQSILIKECSEILDGDLGFVETVRRLNGVKSKAEGIRIPDEFTAWDYGKKVINSCGFDDLPYSCAEYLRYSSQSGEDITSSRFLPYTTSALTSISSDEPVTAFVLLVSKSLKHNKKYLTYVSELRKSADVHQIMYVIKSPQLAECFKKLGIEVIEESELRKKLGMRVVGVSSDSKKPRTELNLEGKNLEEIARGWNQRRVDSWGPGELKACTWFHVTMIFKRLAESESTEIMYLPYTSSRTAIEYETVRQKINNGYSIDIINPKDADHNNWFAISSDHGGYSSYADRMARMMSLLKAMCGDWVLVLSDSAYQSIPEEFKPRFVNLYEKVRQLAHNETGDIERLWKSGAFKLKQFLQGSMGNPILTPNLFKSHADAYKLAKFFHKNYHSLSEVDKALIKLFNATPEAPKDKDYSIVNYDTVNEAAAFICGQFPLLNHLTYAPKEDVQNYIQAMIKFNKSIAKKGNKENE